MGLPDRPFGHVFHCRPHGAALVGSVKCRRVIAPFTAASASQPVGRAGHPFAFHIYHRFGACDSDPPSDSFDALYDELAAEDDEHPEVSVGHESEWSLGAFVGGLLVWENVEDCEPRHMRDASRENVIRLWRLLAAGDLDAIQAEPWLQGYG